MAVGRGLPGFCLLSSRPRCTTRSICVFIPTELGRIDRETELMLYKEADVQARISVKSDKAGYSLDTQASGSYSAAGAKAKAVLDGPVSRGYTEEIDHSRRHRR